MNWKSIGIIFRKELLDTLRDRKTLIYMVALPTLIAPALITLLARVTQHEVEKAQTRRLCVQIEPEERERLLAFLRARIEPMQGSGAQVLAMLGPAVDQPLRAIAQDLAISPIETLLTLDRNERARGHPRYAELRAALASAHDRAADMLRQGGSPDAPALEGIDLKNRDDPRLKELTKFVALLSPLVTIDYVAASEVAGRAARRPAVPESELPPKIRGDPARVAAALAISREQIQAWVHVPRALDAEVIDRNDSVTIEVVYDSTIEFSDEAQRRIGDALAAANEIAARERLDREQLPTSFVRPVVIESRNSAPPQKQILKFIAAFLPYLLILMCFVGGLNPATDLGAGEKERLTLETLLVAPPRRIEIAIGKFGVIFLSSLVASLLATGSMAWTFTSGIASPKLAAALDLRLTPSIVFICLALITPLAATFASLMLALSIYAKSQKEAQALMMPLQFLIIIPAALSTIPSLQLDLKSAWFPVMNVALGMRAVLTAGGATLPWLELLIIFVSTSIFAAAALLFCARRFSQDKVIFRS